MSEQYKVVEGSQSGHCCFYASVVDLQDPTMIGGEHYNNQYEQVCECFSMKDAEMIAKALNQRAELLEALKNVMGYVEEGWIPDGESMFHARAAITKAEAAE